MNAAPLDERDLLIFTNSVNASVTVRHRPTRLDVTCCESRSLHKNRAAAIELLTKMVNSMPHTPESRSAEYRKRSEMAQRALTLAYDLLQRGEPLTLGAVEIIGQGLAACDLSRPLLEAEA